MNGYPPGTECVITHRLPTSRAQIGEIVTVGLTVIPLSERSILSPFTGWQSQHIGLLVQELMIPSKFSIAKNGNVWHPVAWMRPKPSDDQLDLDVYSEKGVAA